MIARGSRGRNVIAIQALLHDAGAYTGNLDGIYGPRTEQAVKTWQGLIGAKTDGRWGHRTNRATIEFVDAISKDMTQPDPNRPPVVPTVPLEATSG